jgi:hypothetical protein
MRKMKMIKSVLILLAALILINGKAFAMPLFEEVYFFTERVAWMPDGWGYQFGVIVSDDSGNNITSVIATESSSSLAFELEYDGLQWVFDPSRANPPTLDKMLIVAKNNINETTVYTTKSINPKPLDYVQNVHTNSDLISPTFYWDSVEFADKYRIRISNSSGKLIYNSLNDTPDFAETYYTIPQNILALNEEYTVRISASETSEGVTLNRSSLLYRYSTSPSVVPEPTSAVLLSAGLMIMMYVSRRKSPLQ